MPDWILKGLTIPLWRVSPSPEGIGTCLKLVGLRNTIVVHQSSNKDRLPIPRGCRWDHPVQDQEMVGGLCPAQQRGDQNMESNFKHYRPVFSPREAPRPGLPRAEARPETGSVTEGCRLAGYAVSVAGASSLPPPSLLPLRMFSGVPTKSLPTSPSPSSPGAAGPKRRKEEKTMVGALSPCWLPPFTLLTKPL